MEQMSDTIQLPKPAILDIRTYPDPILRERCKEVSEITFEIKELIQNMFLTMYKNNGVGLSANQVGRLERIFVMDTSIDGDKRHVFINPEIVETTTEPERWKEGCLSFPDIFVFVKRPTKIKVRALNEQGEKVETNLEGLDAICFQHELDHLNGIIFVDHLSPVQKNLIKKRLANLKK